MAITISPTFTRLDYYWTAWKLVHNTKLLVYQYQDDGVTYTIWGYDGPEAHVCQIWKGTVPPAIIGSYSQVQNNLDKIDFETNFLDNANKSLKEPFRDRKDQKTLTETNDYLAASTEGSGVATIQITGTWSGTINFEFTIDGTNWSPLAAFPPGGVIFVTSATTNGVWKINASGLPQIRVRASALNSGSATVHINIGSGSTLVAAIQGSPGNIANAWVVKLTDGTNSATVKSPSTAAIATDPAVVVAISPNNTVAVSGTVTSNIGTTGGLALDTTLSKLTISPGAALGSNTQTLVGGSVTSATPNYTNGNINPLSLTTRGLLRVDGSTVIQPVSQASMPWTIDGYGQSGSPNGGVLTVQGDNNNYPLSVIEQSNQTKKNALFRLISGPTPAIIVSTANSFFVVGNTTFTISVNGVVQNYNFTSRAAQSGNSISGNAPAISNGNRTKIRVAVDGYASALLTLTSNLTTGTDIAASLQAQIRANCPGGSGVLVDYNTTTSGAYTIRSVTTGATSSIVVTDGGNASTNVAGILKLGVSNGGTETIGTITNSYSIFEVIELLNANLSNLNISFIEPSNVFINTIATGTGATLQVSAGGSNTVLGFTTSLITGTSGSASTNLAVNGASIPQTFILPVINAPLLVYDIQFLIRGANATLKKFGSADQLTNGVKMEIIQQGQLFGWTRTFLTNGDLISQANSGEILTDAFSDNTEIVKAKFSFKPPIEILPNNIDKIRITIQDNLSGLTSFYVIIEGLVG